jgi:amino acid adenylation domain-containing protein
LRVNAPKGTLTAELRSQIAQRKAELLKCLRDQASPASFVPGPILQRVSKDPAPLSFAQERLWFLEQLEPGSAVYNISRASRLTGKLNIAALEASLTEILRRHEILRSQIHIVDGRPMQMTASPLEFKLNFSDLRSLSGSERDGKIRSQIRVAGEWQFDFAAGLFLRAVLLQINDDQHILVLTTHHIVSDAWSMGILTRELWTLYDAYANGRPLPLQELPVQYLDYAVWQREWLQGEVLEAHLSYWRKELENLPVLNLPTDRPRPARQSYLGARQPIALSVSLTAAVNELSRREGVTQFMTLLAAFQVLLHRYSKQEDVVVGSPIANRNRTELEGLIGFFVNTLVLRVNFSGNPTFQELLSRVRETCLGAYAHQDLPFEKPVEELQPERDMSRNPLFQVMFLLQNTPRHVPDVSNLTIDRMIVESGTAKFDLTLALTDRDGKLSGFIEYNTDLFDRSRVERMVAHFHNLLGGIVADPDQRISTLPLLTEKERHQLLVEWNDTTTAYPKDSCIHELFEAQVESTPQAIAVQFEEKQLTYRELNHRANQLAHYLRRLGIAPEKLVGICIERSIEMVVGLLGILKAGGAYVPLDPAYPRERLEFMLSDSQCSFLVTQQSIVEDGRWRMEDCDSRSSILDPQSKVVCLDSDWQTIAGESEQNLHSETKADNLAYVIYTSGSTGQPKGVAIEHRNTVALLYWAKSVFTNDELAGVLASTSICFDLSVFELFVPLSWGGKAILAENALHLHSITEKNEVTLINTVPSVMAELLAMGDLPTSVRTVNLAGEALRSELVKQIYESTHVEKVYDLYGPSEATTYSTFTLRTAEGSPTIGRPISNTRTYLLDENLQSVPIGTPGEIYIGGAGVARGYLNRPDLTSERFVSSSFNENGAERIYRTGDLARYRPDGDIEFLGRADNQVKIHGYRIELGEIEAVLTKHPTVKDCVVVACEREAQSGKNLVGYVVPGEHSVLSVTELRRYLKEKLPEYMIPSSFVVLEALPLMPNGKADRNALPPPDGKRPPLTKEFVSPRTEIEELIAQTWREVLKIDNVEIYDNFFELGGHSLLATQIVARLQEAFQKEIHLRVLFDAPTIAELAIELERIIREGHGPELPPIMPVPRGEPLPLSLNQAHLWYLDKMIPGTYFFNMPYVYRLSGGVNIKALQEALKEIVRRHEALRTVFAKIDERPVQIIKEGSDFHLPVEDLRSGEPGDVSQRAARLILEEREDPFDLTVGPLLRVKLLRLTDTDSLLLVTLHHIISDHWSMQVFRRELAVLYGAYSDARQSPLVEPAIQFADYAVWERNLIDYGLFEQQLNYWKSNLTPPLLDLVLLNKPTNMIHGVVSPKSKHFELNGKEFQALKMTAQSQNRTPFMYFISALTLWLYSISGDEDIRIVTLLPNRNSLESHRVIGPFANRVIFRIRVTRNFVVEELLTQVRDVMLAAHTNQELPFELLTQALEKQREIKRDSLSNVLALYNRTYSDASSDHGLYFAPINLQEFVMQAEPLATSYDLTFKVRESSTGLTGTVNYKYQQSDYRVRVNATPMLMRILMSIVSVPGERVIGHLLEDFNWDLTLE